MSEVALTVIELAHLGAELGDAVTEPLARWHAAEWGHLYDPEVWNVDVARQEFAEQRALGGGAAPTTYVGLTPDGQVLGSVSLVISDDLAGFEHLGPWMASLYVHEPWRRLGVGRRLVRHLLDQSPARQAGQVYLFTADHVDWYTALGWSRVASTTSGPHGHAVTVMVRPSEAGADSARHPRRAV